MTEPETPLTPEQEARVRRLLVEARVEGPMPAEVAARLDGVLAGLQEERAAAPRVGTGEVVDLAARRRKRASGLLVAAAAVVAVGLGVGQLVKADEEDTTRAGTASNADLDQGVAAQEKAEQAVPQATGAPAPFESPPAQGVAPPPQDQRARTLPEVASTSFRRDIRGLRSRASLRATPNQTIDPEVLSSDPRFICEPADWGQGRLLGVLYDGLPAVVAYRPPQGQTQAVEVLQCGSGAVLRSTVIRTR